MHTVDDFGALRFQAHGLEVGSTVHQSFSIAPDDPLSAETRAAWTTTIGRGDWQTRTETQTRMWSDEKTFYLEARAVAHTAAALYAALAPYGLGRLDPARLDWLASYRQQLAAAKLELQGRNDIPPDVKQSQLKNLAVVDQVAYQAIQSGSIDWPTHRES